MMVHYKQEHTMSMNEMTNRRWRTAATHGYYDRYRPGVYGEWEDINSCGSDTD